MKNISAKRKKHYNLNKCDVGEKVDNNWAAQQKRQVYITLSPYWAEVYLTCNVHLLSIIYDVLHNDNSRLFWRPEL